MTPVSMGIRTLTFRAYVVAPSTNDEKSNADFGNRIPTFRKHCFPRERLEPISPSCHGGRMVRCAYNRLC